jgi:hypothetical protein
VEAGEADLGGAGEEELVLGDLVDLVAVAGEEAGPLQRLTVSIAKRTSASSSRTRSPFR